MPRSRRSFWLSALVLIGCSIGTGPLHSQPPGETTVSPGSAFGGAAGSPVVITSPVVVPHDMAIAELEVIVDVSHTWIGDVVMELSSPSGTTVRLHDGGGGGADDIRLTYTDSGVPSGSLPYDYGCTMQPSGPGTMGDFDGEESPGLWELVLSDSFPSEDDGTLHYWTLRFYDAVPDAAPPSVQGLFCYANVADEEVVVTWDIGATAYDEFRVYDSNGALVVSVDGTTTSVTIAQPPTLEPVSYSVEGLVLGASPSCRRQCFVVFEPIQELEFCSQPEIAFGGELGTPPTLAEVIDVSAAGIIGDVNVAIDLTHSWIGDLDLTTTSPQGTSVVLHNNGGGEDNDIRAIFSDRGAPNGTVPHDFGCYLEPSGPGAMADFTGEDADGSWTLSVVDTYPLLDDGVLHSWCVRIYDSLPGDPSPPVEDLACNPGTQPGTMVATWVNPVPYHEILVSVDSAAPIVLDGSATEYVLTGLPSGTTIETTVSGTLLGGLRSCPQVCASEITTYYQLFVRGDANVDGLVDIGDAVYLLDSLFSAPETSPLLCHDAADVNDDESINIADAIALLAFLFSSGSQVPAPFEACGSDPTLDSTLTCQSYPPCLGFTDVSLATHVLRRMAYGPSPVDLDLVLAMGVVPYIDSQLDPDSIDDSGNAELQDLLTGLQSDSELIDLLVEVVARGTYSNRQLQEQLVDFWDNHFSTYFWTVEYFFYQQPGVGYPQSSQLATRAEFLENQAFRESALGNFEDLVVASATSAAMLVYLDNISNVAGAPNENYARELLELHTMGVDNGYVQLDVEQLARCFTGWTVCKVATVDAYDPHAPCVATGTPGVWTFHFDPASHDYGQKILFQGQPHELIIPARTPGSTEGIDDGFEVLAHLAGIQQTAEFVSRKLIQKFVADDPPLTLVADCIGAWLTTGGDVGEVVSVILHSPEFLSTTNRWSKLRTPLENVISRVRIYAGSTNTVSIINSLIELEQLPFHSFTPDGYPETGADQLSTSRLLSILDFSKRMLDPGADPTFDVFGLVSDSGVDPEDPDAVVDHFVDTLFAGAVLPIDRQLAVDFLTTDDLGNPVPLSLAAPDYVDRVAKLLVFLAVFPQGQKQ